MEILRFKNVSYRANDTMLLNNLNLSINEGDFISISGPSGSGKSTFFKLTSHLISPVSGEIIYRNKNIMEYDPVHLRKKICLCSQMPYLFGDRVLDNLLFPFLQRKLTINMDLINNYLSLLNLDESFLHKHPKNLSGGEKQRIAIIRSVAIKPDILLLDEVTSALDEANTSAVEELIKKLNSNGVTILWITHDSSQYQRLGNRRINIETGNLREVE